MTETQVSESTTKGVIGNGNVNALVRKRRVLPYVISGFMIYCAGIAAGNGEFNRDLPEKPVEVRIYDDALLRYNSSINISLKDFRTEMADSLEQDKLQALEEIASTPNWARSESDRLNDEISEVNSYNSNVKGPISYLLFIPGSFIIAHGLTNLLRNRKNRKKPTEEIQ